jgi:NADH-quinone oxidoreductase subunit I
MKVKRPELTLLKKIFLVDLIKGLLLTFSYQKFWDPKVNYTEQYPKVRPKVAERFRGAPRLNNDPVTGETLCIACNLCALACPEHCIEVGWAREGGASGKKVLTTYTFDISRCMFCGLCEDACPTPCLELTQDFELSLYGRRDMKWDRQKLEEGNQPVVYTK